MEGKKKLEGWQLGVLLVLIVLMLSTMFMPLFNVNGKVTEKTINNINTSLNDSINDIEDDLKDELSPDLKDWFLDEIDNDGRSIADLSDSKYNENDLTGLANEYIEEAIDDTFNSDEGDSNDIDITELLETEFDTEIERSESGYDEFIRFLEKDREIKLTNISPLHIMTHNYDKFIGSDEKKNEKSEDSDTTEENSNGNNADSEDNTTKVSSENDYKEEIDLLERIYNSIRSILIVVYIFCFVVLILTIAAYGASWSKTIPTVIDMIYGIFATAMIIDIRSIVPNIFDGVVALFKNMIVNEFIKMLIEGFMDDFAISKVEVPQKVIDTSNRIIFGFDLGNTDVSELASSLVTFGFIVVPIIAIIIAIFSIVSMLIAGKELYDTNYMSDYKNGQVFNQDDYLRRENRSDNLYGVNNVMRNTPPNLLSNSSNTQNNQQLIQQQQLMQQQPQVNHEYRSQHTAVGKVVCTKGLAYGQSIDLPAGRKIIIGRSTSKSNLVINSPKVSSIHCSIRFNADHNTYIVKDHSTNGTFINGARIEKDRPLEYPAGTVLSLADGSNQITLG